MGQTIFMGAPPPFLWNQIESDDYHRYVANLRTVGCPEQLVRDLVTAELNQFFAPRFAGLWPPRCALYWQKRGNQEPGPAEAKELQALNKEQADTFKQITGAVLDPQSVIDILFLQVWGVEQELLFLPADKQQAAHDALVASDLQEKLTNPQREDQDHLHSDKFFEDKCKIIAKVLTPAELEEYRLRNSPAVVSLRTELQYFECTPGEFKALLELRAKKANARRRFGDPAADADDARSLFGEVRAKEFARVTDAFYTNARAAAEEYGLSLEPAERAWQITYDARAMAHQMANDKKLSTEIRKQRLDALFQQADVQINKVLGEKPSRALRRDLAVVLRSLQGGQGCCHP